MLQFIKKNSKHFEYAEEYDKEWKTIKYLKTKCRFSQKTDAKSELFLWRIDSRWE